MDKRTSMSSGFKGRFAKAFSFLPSAKTVAKAMKRATSRVPFMDDVLAMYYCAIDPKTPKKVRFIIGATLLYLVMPLDFIPDLLAIVGYTDDLTALMVLLRLVSSHVTDKHREKAKESLVSLRNDPEGEPEAAAV